MRISDWSSDVCYSDLIALALGQQPLGTIVGGLEQRRVRLQPAGLEDHRQRLLDMRVAVVLVGAAHVGAGIPLAVVGLALRNDVVAMRRIVMIVRSHLTDRKSTRLNSSH